MGASGRRGNRRAPVARILQALDDHFYVLGVVGIDAHVRHAVHALIEVFRNFGHAVANRVTVRIAIAFALIEPLVEGGLAEARGIGAQDRSGIGLVVEMIVALLDAPNQRAFRVERKAQRAALPRQGVGDAAVIEKHAIGLFQARYGRKNCGAGVEKLARLEIPKQVPVPARRGAHRAARTRLLEETERAVPGRIKTLDGPVLLPEPTAKFGQGHRAEVFQTAAGIGNLGFARDQRGDHENMPLVLLPAVPFSRLTQPVKSVREPRARKRDARGVIPVLVRKKVGIQHPVFLPAEQHIRIAGAQTQRQDDFHALADGVRHMVIQRGPGSSRAHGSQIRIDIVPPHVEANSVELEARHEVDDSLAPGLLVRLLVQQIQKAGKLPARGVQRGIGHRRPPLFLILRVWPTAWPTQAKSTAQSTAQSDSLHGVRLAPSGALLGQNDSARSLFCFCVCELCCHPERKRRISNPAATG